MDVRKMNLPLPGPLHAALFREARRLGVPATRLAREILSSWLAERARAEEAEEMRQFARALAGSDLDLDTGLEAAGLETLREGSHREAW
jgi:hypothetical protein